MLKSKLSHLLLALILTLNAWAQDQQTLNQMAAQDFAKADKELNQAYKKLTPLLGKKQKELLIDAQLLWVKYRDTNARAIAEVNAGGSIYPMIYDGARTRVTKQRTQEFLEWIKDYSDS